MQRRWWGGLAAFLFVLWLLVAIWAIRGGVPQEKRDSNFEKSFFDNLKKDFPEPDEP